MQNGAVSGNLTLVGNRLVYDSLGKADQFDRFVEGMSLELKRFCAGTRGTSLWPVVMLRDLKFKEVIKMLQSRVKVEFDSGVDERTPINNRDYSASYMFFHFGDSRNNENQWMSAHPDIPLEETLCTSMTLLETLVLLLACDSTEGCGVKRVFQDRQFLVCAGSLFCENYSIPSIHIAGDGLLFSCYNADLLKQSNIMKPHVVQIALPKKAVLDPHS